MIRVQVVQRTTKANLCRRAGRSLRVTALHASISPHDRTSAYDAHQLIPKPPPPPTSQHIRARMQLLSMFSAYRLYVLDNPHFHRASIGKSVSLDRAVGAHR